MRRAFTIVELLISVALIGIIVIFLYSLTGNLQNQNRSYEARVENEEFSSKFQELLFRDMLEIVEDNIEISEGIDREYSVLRFKTHNSLHNLANPYVLYGVSREEKTLIRAESIVDFNTSNENFTDLTKATVVSRDVERFSVNSGKDRTLFLLDIKGRDPIYFQVLKIGNYQRTPVETNTTSGNDTNQSSSSVSSEQSSSESEVSSSTPSTTPPSPPSSNDNSGNLPPSIPSGPTTPGG